MGLRKKITILVILLLLLILGGIYYMNSKKIVAKGDTVKIDYLGTLENGNVFDTNILEESKKAGTYTEQRSYEPLEFTVGAGQMIPGFEEAVLDMKEGETKTVTIPAEKAYGIRREDLFLKGLPREVKVARYSNLSKDQFKEIFEKEAILGETLTTKNVPWEVKVVEIKDNQVKVESVVTTGQVLQLPGTNWNSIVKTIGDTAVTLFQNPEEGQRAVLPYQGRFVSGKITHVQEKNYDLDLNHELAGKNLTFRITVKEVKKITLNSLKPI